MEKRVIHGRKHEPECAVISRPGKRLSRETELLSTTARGDEFRDAIAALFRTKYEDVRTEEEIAGKTIDITYRENIFGKVETIGIECKFYSRPLTANYISEKIWSGYSHLLQNGQLHYLIIVAPLPLGATAQKRVQGMRGLRFRTYQQLEDDLLGLRRYFEIQSRLFSADGLSAYYIDARFEKHGEPAIDYIQSWINGKEAYPLAVLGGYGKGKTSLAKRVVAKQAVRYLKDPTERMPILIRLGETVHETTLEGLFGREFTSRFRTQDYHFDTLWHLNSQGRLLVVLDGFDEMKHGMSVIDFKTNFQQFNRLVTGKSRVLLLGRPNALPSEIRSQVLRGRRIVDEVEVSAPDRKAWHEVTISSFNPKETEIFLRRYLKHLIDTAAYDAHVIKKSAISARVREIMKKTRLDLLSRPVHARIIAELAADPTFNLSGITEYRLYEEFIKRIVERDALEKPARKRISVTHRLKFQEELAYWAWTRPGQVQGSFRRDEIPHSLIAELDDGGTVDDEAKLNEYLVSTVTEEKEASHLFFEHRSFQEFLVSEKLRHLSKNDVNHTAMSKAILSEVAGFLLGGPSLKFLEEWFGSLAGSRAAVSLLYLSLYAYSESSLRILERKMRVPEPKVEEIGVIGTCLRVKNHIFTDERVMAFLLKIIRRSASPTAAEFAMYLMMRLRTGTDTLERILRAALDRIEDRRDYQRKVALKPVEFTQGSDYACESTERHLRLDAKDGVHVYQWAYKKTFNELQEHLIQSGQLILDDQFGNELPPDQWTEDLFEITLGSVRSKRNLMIKGSI